MEAGRQVLTFLMTDVVGSTHLWEEHPDAMATAMLRYDAIVEMSVSEHGGRLVKLRGEGDSHFAVFTDPASAIRCACSLQIRVESEPWPEECTVSVRAAVNTGSAVMRDADYYGTPVNVCARLRAAGHGGQVLVGATSSELAREALGTEIELRDLGPHDLPGITQHVRVFQAVHPRLRASFPLLRTPAHVPCNLPYPPSPVFVGRDSLLDDIHRALTAAPPRNVALVGIPGIGKTQAAVEYGHRHRCEYPGGVFFVVAADTTRLHLDCASIGSFFDLPENLSAKERSARVRAELQRSEMPVLLIVDGLTEQTVRAALPQGPRCRIVVTCNQRHLVPSGFCIIEPSPLAEDDALRLLQCRRAANGNAEMLAAREIASDCGHLPLALSLVANHIDRLGISFAEYRALLAESPVEALTRARRRFMSDTGHEGGLFDAIALLYRSLDPPAQDVLTAASLMAGRGMSPAVLFDGSGITDWSAFAEAVGDLVDDSLLYRESGARLSMHRIVRLLVEEMTPAHHRIAALDRATQSLAERLRKANDAMEWSETRPEIPHCYAVADHCRRHLRHERLESLMHELGRHLFSHGEHADAATCFDEAARVAKMIRGPQDQGRALAIRRRGEARHRLGDREAAARDCDEALQMATALLSPYDPRLADYYVAAGYVRRMSGQLDEAQPYYEQAMLILDAAHGRRHPATATCLNNLGALREAQGDLQGALALLREAMDIDIETLGRVTPRVAVRLNNLGRVYGKLGNWQQALVCHEEALATNQAAYGPSHPDIAGTYYHLGLASRGLGDHSAATHYFAQALAMARRYFDETHPFCRMIRAAMTPTTGDPEPT